MLKMNPSRSVNNVDCMYFVGNKKLLSTLLKMYLVRAWMHIIHSNITKHE